MFRKLILFAVAFALEYAFGIATELGKQTAKKAIAHFDKNDDQK